MNPVLLNNRYRVIQPLGTGGFGNTFLAEDTYMPSARRCVIKQLKPVTNDPAMYQQVQARFQREAAVLEDLGQGNPQIPSLYAYFSENGQFYLIQEWIEGETLTKKVEQQGTLSEAAVREILVSLLPVLDYVHSRRMVHRDIKPDNIIMRRQDGKPVLIDFGAVKEAMGTLVNSQGHSVTIGTPGYMPSEQAAGQPVYASDLYSLGLTAIYLLTGKTPDALETDPGTGEFIWRQTAPNISPSLAGVLDKAIQSHPRDRFSTAKEMLAALQSGTVLPATNATVAIGGAAPVSPQSVPARSSPVIQGRKWNPWVLAGLIAAGLVAAAVAISALLHRDPQTSPRVASSPSPVAEAPVRSPAASPRVERSPETRSEESPPPIIAASPSPVASSRERDRPVSESPSPTIQNSPATIPASPSPVASESPSPDLPSPKPNQNQNSSNSVPIFPTGASRSDVEAALGKRKDARGAWENTRAVIYPLVPNQIDLGYLFDSQTGRIRQTEASFAESVDLPVMETTLDGLLNGASSNEIKRGLKRVQQRRADNFKFTQGALKGQIVRQDCGVIYISIWDADLHNFNVETSRQC
jgi:serine/threonine-protein kinase